MVDSLKSRPNHYERLGLQPSAKADEIAQAFTRKMSLFQADLIGSAAQICIAYETLRDPRKRRDYDRSLGLTRERTARLPHWTYAAAQPHWPPFIAAAEKSIAAPAREAPAAAEPHVTPTPALEPRVDPRLAAIASSIRELAKPDAPEDVSPKPKLQPVQSRAQGPEIGVEELIEQIRATGFAEKERLGGAQKAAFDWKRPALTLGGLVAGAAIFGAMTGLSLKGEEVPAPAEAASPEMHRMSAHPLQLAGPSPAPADLARETPPQPRARADFSGLRHERRISRQRRTSSFEQQVAESLANPDPADTQAGTLPKDQPVTEAAQPVAANLPLSRTLIARTIKRIGYACGEVSSSEPAEGNAQGVYKITCSSGQIYQATPVHGRYHFRHLGSP